MMKTAYRSIYQKALLIVLVLAHTPLAVAQRGSSDLVKTQIDGLKLGIGYESVIDAVVEATNRYNPDSIAHNREHVGGVLGCNDGRVLFTHGVGRPDQVPVSFSVPQTSNCRLEALWHTHGARDDFKTMFSAADTNSSNALGRPIYMADHTGALRVFEPGSKTSGRQQRNRRSIVRLDEGVAAGKIVKDRRGKRIKIRTVYPK